ncbi:MAG: DUF7149 domain-containing protein [Sphingobacteriaceae bacterium]
MKLAILKPSKALNLAFRKVKPQRTEIESFKANLIHLLDQINLKESEEFHKNIISKFLHDTYYDKRFYINTKHRNDLVIHNDKTAKSSVGVIIEAKSPANRSEMLTKSNINTKAFQELVLYYLRERITHKNLEVKHLIVTNIHEWFIFDANIFERLFAKNKTLVKQFEDFEAGRLSGKNTDFFYREIAAPFIENISHEIELTYFDVQDYEKPLRNASQKDDTKLISLFKLLSPEHLLKLPFANDSNTLDKRFYSELLHILGLTETKQGGKKLIGRNKEGQRNTGSILEDTIIQLDSLDKINRLEKPSQYGETHQERLFNVALELSITWINRILFLKLLEAQLISYHKGDKSYSFLNHDRIKEYDDLNILFFQVLAKGTDERNDDVKKLYQKVPYLNSSLFEPTEMEHVTLFISNLHDNKTIPIIGNTVLKDSHGKKRTGNLPTLQYLFDFLNAYDFSSEGSEDIQEDNKTLINASVLGLIFEKINGYKDGSFFTPGFITMYMCRETIRKAVVQKFNEVKNWNCTDFNELYNHIEDRDEANDIINSIKVCDPAVGSGHFLVSALNEFITIKSDLRVLQDREGRRLKEYAVEIVNDELMVTDEDSELFEYNPANKESQRVQEALFHEKQTIIENCLFGVDININSVKICRLRLWIELLKNAYYRSATELETLPNIDINIKCGNSLVSRFPIDADLKKALKKSKWNIDSYRTAVSTYRNAETKEQKREMKRLIADIKSDFRSEISRNDPKAKNLRKATGELAQLTTQHQLFDMSKKEKAAWNKKVEKLTTDIRKFETEIEEIRSNKIYENAFEWRFEFPEVLNNDGDFVGFDVVIGNPPYMRVQEIQATQPLAKKHYETQYQNAKAAYDLANVFFELAVNVSASLSSNAYIFPHKFFNAAASVAFRNYLKNGQYIDEVAHFGANMIFEDADTYTCVAQFSKKPSEGFYFQRFSFKSDFKSLMLDKGRYTFTTYEMIERAAKLYGSNQWILFDNESGIKVFEKIYSHTARIATKFDRVSQGIATGKDEIYLFKGVEQGNYVVGHFIKDSRTRSIEKGILKPFLKGKDVQRYSSPVKSLFVLFPYGLTESGKSHMLTESDIAQNFPNAYNWLKETELIHRRKDNRSTDDEFWYRFARNQGIDFIEQCKLSSMEICSKYPNVIFNDAYFYHPTTVYSWIKNAETKESYEFLLAIANSKLLWWFLFVTGDTLQGDARRFKTNYLNPFPLPEHVSEQAENEIVLKVKEILKIRKENLGVNTSSLEDQVDRLIYQLYKLNEEEIAIIENV